MDPVQICISDHCQHSNYCVISTNMITLSAAVYFKINSHKCAYLINSR